MIKKLFGNRLMVFVWTVIVSALIGMGINYLALVPMNINSSSFWWFMISELVITIVVAFVFNMISRIINEDDHYSFTFKDYIKNYTIPAIFIAILVIFILVMFFTSISGWKMTNAEKYSNVITIEEGSFVEEVPNTSENQNLIVYVDKKTAQKLGDQTLGEVKNSSWYEVDKYNMVSINETYYWISPINYGGFFASRKVRANGGIPGYISVDTQTQEATFVYFNEDEKMIYSPSGNFGYDLNRHIYQKYPTKILGESIFQVDDNNHPYWITEVKTPTIGMRGGVIVKSFIITDATSGEMKEYTINTLPTWIEQAYSVDSLMEMIGWYYRYQNGYWNFSKTELYKTTYSYRDSELENRQEEKVESTHTPFDGYNTAISKDGNIIFYTGITPDNKAETNKGFVSANARTGEVRFYSVTGAEEFSAQIAAEGLTKNMQYSASFPILINVDGVETYFMVLKDVGGLVRRYALCNIKNYSKCVESEDIDEAIIKYKKEIGLIAAEDSDKNINSDKNKEMENVNTIEISGLVEEVKEAQIEGYTYYYFTLEGADLVFMSSINNSNMQPMKLVVGSTVTIKYYDSTESGIGIVKEISFK